MANRNQRWRITASLTLLALVAVALYGATILRFGTMIGAAR